MAAALTSISVVEMKAVRPPCPRGGVRTPDGDGGHRSNPFVGDRETQQLVCLLTLRLAVDHVSWFAFASGRPLERPSRSSAEIQRRLCALCLPVILHHHGDGRTPEEFALERPALVRLVIGHRGRREDAELPAAEGPHRESGPGVGVRHEVPDLDRGAGRIPGVLDALHALWADGRARLARGKVEPHLRDGVVGRSEVRPGPAVEAPLHGLPPVAALVEAVGVDHVLTGLEHPGQEAEVLEAPVGTLGPARVPPHAAPVVEVHRDVVQEEGPAHPVVRPDAGLERAGLVQPELDLVVEGEEVPLAAERLTVVDVLRDARAGGRAEGGEGLGPLGVPRHPKGQQEVDSLGVRGLLGGFVKAAVALVLPSPCLERDAVDDDVR